MMGEHVDGRNGSEVPDGGTGWPTYVGRIQAAADAHAPRDG